MMISKSITWKDSKVLPLSDIQTVSSGNSLTFHANTIKLKPSKVLFGGDLPYFSLFEVQILQNGLKIPEFRVVGSRIRFLRSTDEVDIVF